jgi:hypothetical protein
MTESSHTPTLDYQENVVHWREKDLPAWGWCLAILTFPSGFFAAFGVLKVLRRRAAIGLTAISYLSLAGVVPILISADRQKNPSLSIGCTLSMMCIASGWGALIFHIGKNSNVWSPGTRRAWMYVAILALVMLCAGFAGLAMTMSVKSGRP